MEAGAIVQMTIWNSYTGLPWELGAETKTTFQFLDPSGRMAALERKIGKARDKATKALEAAGDWKSFMSRFWLARHFRQTKKREKLSRRGQLLAGKLLRRHPSEIGLKVRYMSDSEPFQEVESPVQTEELRANIGSADRSFFFVLSENE